MNRKTSEEIKAKSAPNKKAGPTATAHNNGLAGSQAKINIMVDCFGLLSQMHYPPRLLWGAGPACPDGRPARAPSSPASCRPAKAVLRRGFGRKRSGRWPVTMVAVPKGATWCTSANPAVVCNKPAQRQRAAAKTKTKKSIAEADFLRYLM